MCTATHSAYPQVLQYILGYFSIFVHTHDGYIRIFSRITHTHMITEIISTCANNVSPALPLHPPPPPKKKFQQEWERESAWDEATQWIQQPHEYNNQVGLLIQNRMTVIVLPSLQYPYKGHIAPCTPCPHQKCKQALWIPTCKSTFTPSSLWCILDAHPKWILTSTGVIQATQHWKNEDQLTRMMVKDFQG